MAFSLKRKTVATVDHDYFFSKNVAMQAGSKKPINDRYYHAIKHSLLATKVQ